MALYNGTCYIEQISQDICYFPWVPFHSPIWDRSLLFHGIRVKLLEDAIHDSGSANFFSLTGARNSSNVRCSSTFVKQLQALRVILWGKATYTSLHLGQQGLLGAVWVFPFLCQKTNPHRPSRAMYHHVKPTQKLSGTRRSLVQVRYQVLSMPHNRHSQRQSRDMTPVITTPLSVFHRGNPTKLHCPGHRDMVSHCFLSATAGS